MLSKTATSCEQSSVFTLTSQEHISMKSYLKSFKASKDRSLSKICTLFRRPKICKQNFLSFQSFKVFNETVFKSNSSPDIIMQNNDNDGNRNNFIYSNIYFKFNQPLFGYKIDLGNVLYNFNNLKIYPHMHCNISYEYVPIFHRKYLNKSSGVLLFPTPTIKRINSRKSINKLNKNTKIFKNYISAIIYNHKNESDSYNSIKDYSYRNSNKYNKTYRFKIRSKNYTVDLDEISPVDDETQLTSSPFNQQHKSTNRTLISTSNRNEMFNDKDQSECDTNIIILQPLQLESMKNFKLNKDKKILSDHKKIVRLTIFYTLSFFALAIITFFIIYLT